MYMVEMKLIRPQPLNPRIHGRLSIPDRYMYNGTMKGLYLHHEFIYENETTGYPSTYICHLT